MPVPNLTRNILLALVCGIIFGLYLPDFAGFTSWMGLIFKLSLMMIAVPLIFTSVISSLEHIGDISKLGKLGVKTISFYTVTTAIAVMTGIIVVNVIQPGVLSPKTEVKDAISRSHAESPEAIPFKILHAVEDKHVHLTDNARFDFIHSLAEKVNRGGTEQDVQKHALKVIGALEFRSKLKQDASPAETKVSSMYQFVISQIKQTLINPFHALANSHILAIIVFALLLGGALTTIGEEGRIVFQLNHALNRAVIKIVFLFLRFAPFGIFSLIYDVTAKSGIDVFRGVSMYMLSVFLGLGIHLFITLPLILILLAGYSPIKLFKKMHATLALSFSTSSTASALPVTIRCAENEVGIPKRISRFVLSLGSSLNMNGTALYEAMAALFVAQLYGMDLSLSTQIIIGITAALAATGCSAIPSSGAISLTLIFSAIGIPMEGIGLLLAVDLPLSMSRAMVNVAGDGVAAVVIAQSEMPGCLDENENLQEAFAAHVIPEANA